jgi:hypothetical protein
LVYYNFAAPYIIHAFSRLFRPEWSFCTILYQKHVVYFGDNRINPCHPHLHRCHSASEICVPIGQSFYRCEQKRDYYGKEYNQALQGVKNPAPMIKMLSAKKCPSGFRWSFQQRRCEGKHNLSRVVSNMSVLYCRIKAHNPFCLLMSTNVWEIRCA